MSKSASESSSEGDSTTSSSWCLVDSEHPKYYRKGGYHPVSINELYNNRYRTIKKLGWGYFSTVWLVWDYDENIFKAMKVQKSNKSATKAAKDEIELSGLLRDCQHVNVMLDSFQVSGKYGTHYCMIFRVLGSNLDTALKKIKRFPLKDVKTIIECTRQGLVELKELDIIHADLKTENILITKPNKKIQRVMEAYKPPPKHTEPKLLERHPHTLTKSQKKRWKKMFSIPSDFSSDDEEDDYKNIVSVTICDLGSACKYTDKYSTEVQTKHYMAPEVLLGNDYNHAIDLWSLGCIGYELFTGRLLFDCDSDSDDDISYEENHLAHIVELTGKLPSYMIDKGTYSKKYLTGGEFNNIHKLSPQSLQEKLESHELFTVDEVKSMLKCLNPYLIVDMDKRYREFYKS